MAVGGADERGVGARGVGLANARRAPGGAAGAPRRPGERSGSLAGGGGEGEVKAQTGRPRLGPGREDREGGLAFESWRPISYSAYVSKQAHVAERSQHGVVERGGTIEVLDPDGEMIEHIASLGEQMT